MFFNIFSVEKIITINFIDFSPIFTFFFYRFVFVSRVFFEATFFFIIIFFFSPFSFVSKKLFIDIINSRFLS